MIKHYIVQALRSFWRFRVTAGVNLLGFVLAVVCFVASYLYIDSLARSDTHFSKASRTYALTTELWRSGVKTSPASPRAAPLAAAYLEADFPLLEAVARAVPLGPLNIASDDRKADVLAVGIDPEFFEIFDLDFKSGDPAAAVVSLHSAVVTERTAERLFGKGEALGRSVVLQNRTEVIITGVVAPVQKPSHMAEGNELAFDILVPMPLLKEMRVIAGYGTPVDPDEQDWGADLFRTYLLFPADGSFAPEEFLQQLPAFAERRANGPGARLTTVLGAVPLSSVQLAIEDSLYSGGAFSLTTMVLALAVLILAVACINYANLAVAIATTRTRELGMRKVVGATRLHLVHQCLVESGLLGITAVALVVVLAVLLIEPANRALEIDLRFASLLEPRLWLMVAGLLAAISLIGGMYPAFALARVRPADALRANSARGGRRSVPIVLVGVEFAAASFLLAVALVMAKQNRMLLETGLRADRDPIVAIGINIQEQGLRFDTLRDELLRSPNIEAVGSANALPWGRGGGGRATMTRSQDASAIGVETMFNPIGYHFFDALELGLLAGRLLDQEHGDEAIPFFDLKPGQEEKVLIDRALAAALGWNEPNAAVGELTYAKVGPRVLPFRIVGVVEDGYPRLVGTNTSSNVYGLMPSLSGVPLVRVSRENVAAAVKDIDDAWDRLLPKVQIRREFTDVLLDKEFRNYSRISSILSGLSACAFLIAVMGLCGFAIHAMTRRQREIGIRKTLGAGKRSIVTMLLVDFAKPVVIANLVAWPFAWWVGHQYIEKFTRQIEITIWPFLLSLVITVGIAWAAVIFQSMRAAAMKPVNVLHRE